MRGNGQLLRPSGYSLLLLCGPSRLFWFHCACTLIVEPASIDPDSRYSRAFQGKRRVIGSLAAFRLRYSRVSAAHGGASMPRFVPLLIWVCLIHPAYVFGAESARARATIYRCEVEGVATFSDRPCGERSSAYEPEAALLSTYTAPPTPVATHSGKPSRPKSIAGPSSIAAEQAKRTEECQRIQASLRDIRSRMRAGYSAKEGERLRARQERLEDRRRSQRCR
jgi:hypothetical protein